MDPVYIHGLRVDSFMRIELVELRFDGPGLTVIEGGNAEGKSSLLKAAEALFGGKAALPPQPVRQGAEKAEIVADLGDRIVRLRVKPDRSTTLVVETRDGLVAKSPQKLLDELKGALGFAPLAFLRLAPRDQAETLRKLVGLDTSALDAEHARVYDERTGVNRDARMLEGQLSGIVVPPEPEAPPAVEVPEEVDVVELAERQRAALAKKADNDRRRKELESARWDVGQREASIQSLEKEIARLLAARDVAAEELETARLNVVACEADVARLADPDLAAIASDLSAAKGKNAAARQAREAAAAAMAQVERARADRVRAEATRTAKASEVTAKKTEAARLTARLDEIDAEKARLLASTPFPCDGLGIEGDTVTYQGVPLSQASGAEGIRVALEIGAALNPRLRLLLVDEGDALDLVRLRQVADWAKERGYGVWMTRVAGERPTGVEIRAGKVAADHRQIAAAPAATEAP